MIRPVSCAAAACAQRLRWCWRLLDRPWLRPRCVIIRRYYEFVPWIRRPTWAWAPGEGGRSAEATVARAVSSADRTDASRPGGLRPWPFRVHRVVLPGEVGVGPESASPQPPGRWLDVTA
jgi:hypothetical protein